MNTLEIYNAHIEAFKTEKFTYFKNESERKFKTKEEIKPALENGEIIPELFRKTVEYALSPGQQIGLWALLAFSSKQAESKFKTTFIQALNNFGIK